MTNNVFKMNGWMISLFGLAVLGTYIYRKNSGLTRGVVQPDRSDRNIGSQEGSKRSKEFDRVDEASRESFPASDPPSWNMYN